MLVVWSGNMVMAEMTRKSNFDFMPFLQPHNSLIETEAIVRRCKRSVVLCIIILKSNCNTVQYWQWQFTDPTPTGNFLFPFTSLTSCTSLSFLYTPNLCMSLLYTMTYQFCWGFSFSLLMHCVLGSNQTVPHFFASKKLYMYIHTGQWKAIYTLL